MERVEHGFALCRRRDGSLAQGSTFSGDHNNVQVALDCPGGTEPVATYHEHPDGVAEPSPQDITEHKRAGLHWACIRSDRELRCHYIP